jgi:hypothetical protein
VAVVDVSGDVQPDPGVVVLVVVGGDELVEERARAWVREPNRSAKTGRYFSVLNSDSLYGLSLLTLGRECERVTFRSASRAATVLDVIEVPRSACTTCGTPWIPKISLIISWAKGPDSWACTCAPMMYRE